MKEDWSGGGLKAPSMDREGIVRRSDTRLSSIEATNAEYRPQIKVEKDVDDVSRLHSNPWEGTLMNY